MCLFLTAIVYENYGSHRILNRYCYLYDVNIWFRMYQMSFSQYDMYVVYVYDVSKSNQSNDTFFITTINRHILASKKYIKLQAEHSWR